MHQEQAAIAQQPVEPVGGVARFVGRTAGQRPRQSWADGRWRLDGGLVQQPRGPPGDDGMNAAPVGQGRQRLRPTRGRPRLAHQPDGRRGLGQPRGQVAGGLVIDGHGRARQRQAGARQQVVEDAPQQR